MYLYLVFFSEWTGIGCVLLFDHFSLAINIWASPRQIDSNFLQKPWYSEKLGKKKQWCSKMKIHSVIIWNEKIVVRLCTIEIYISILLKTKVKVPKWSYAKKENYLMYTANVLSVEFTDECLPTKSELNLQWF